MAENRWAVEGASVKLTPRGQEVAELVALGLSNREIAQRLFLSERTVEWHVVQILNRLGFTSRSQVAAWVGRTQAGTVVRTPGATRKGNLPAALTPFVGRERELAAIRELMTANRLVTVIGAGGSGKTRLAVRLAEELGPGYPDGAWLCELGPLDDEDLLGDSLAHVLGIAKDADDSLREYLRDRALLLVLDNCEHVLRAASEVARDLLTACPDLRVIATSRAALGVLGEAVWRLDPLPEEAAIRLFVQRAEAATPGFRLEPGDAEHVATICRHLDGIPLALELAAPKLRVLSLGELAQSVLEATWQGRATDRHAGLEALVAWSYRLLQPEERALFRRLSVFAAWFDLDDAAALAPPAVPVPSLLASLVEQSMLVAKPQAKGASHYRLLETIKAFGRARLAETGELEEARLAHAERIVWLQDQLVSVFRGKVDDVRAALSTLLELHPQRGAQLAASMVYHWSFTGRCREGLRWTSAALVAIPNPSAERCWVLYARAALFLLVGQRDEAETCFQEATLLADMPECAPIRPELLDAAARVHEGIGDHTAGEVAYRRAIALYDQRGDAAKAARAYNQLAMSLLHQGRAAEARQQAERSVELRRALSGDLGGTIDTLAQAHFLLGDLEQARECWLEAFPEGLKEDTLAASYCLEGLALIAGERGKKEAALRLHYCADLQLTELGEGYNEPVAPRLRNLLDRLRVELGPERSACLQAEGEALSLASALELAQAEV